MSSGAGGTGMVHGKAESWEQRGLPGYSDTSVPENSKVPDSTYPGLRSLLEVLKPVLNPKPAALNP